MTIKDCLRQIFYENVYVRIILTTILVNLIIGSVYVVSIYYIPNATEQLCHNSKFREYYNRIFFGFPVSDILCDISIIFGEYQIQYTNLMCWILIILPSLEFSIILNIENIYLGILYHYSVPDSQLRQNDNWYDYLWGAKNNDNVVLTNIILCPIIVTLITFLFVQELYVKIIYIIFQFAYPMISVMVYKIMMVYKNKYHYLDVDVV